LFPSRSAFIYPLFTLFRRCQCRLQTPHSARRCRPSDFESRRDAPRRRVPCLLHSLQTGAIPLALHGGSLADVSPWHGMTNDQVRMTNEIRNQNDRAAVSGFSLRHSLVIRASSFVICFADGVGTYENTGLV